MEIEIQKNEPGLAFSLAAKEIRDFSAWGFPYAVELKNAEDVALAKKFESIGLLLHLYSEKSSGNSGMHGVVSFSSQEEALRFLKTAVGQNNRKQPSYYYLPDPQGASTTVFAANDL